MGSLLDEIFEDIYERGKKKGTRMALYRLVDDGILSLEDAAERASLSVHDFKEKMAKHKADEAEKAKMAEEGTEQQPDP